MFKRVEGPTLARRSVTITLDGVPIEVPEDETVAAVLLQSGRPDFELRWSAVRSAARTA